MPSSILILLIASLCYDAIFCNTVTSTAKLPEAIHEEISSINDNNNSQPQKEELLRKNFILSRYKSAKLEDLKRIANMRIHPSSRRSKLLGSLAFLTGLSVTGLTNSASASTKAYSQIPPLTFNLGASRLSPNFAAYYDSYPLIPHPYVVNNPFPLYSILEPSRVQSLIEGQAQNSLQSLSQNQLVAQLLNLLSNKKPLDPLESNDECAEGAEKSENEKTLNDVEEETDENEELLAENERNAEEKLQTVSQGCGGEKNSQKNPNHSSKDHEDLQQDADGSLETLSFRLANMTYNRHNKTQDYLRAKQRISTNTTRAPQMQNTTHPPMTTTHTTHTTHTTQTTHNSTERNNETTTSFPGYYYGNPQPVEDINFTTEPDSFRYHDNDQIHYHLPYERPANFYPDDRYNYYQNSPINSFPSSQYQHEQMPEYISSDFNRLLYLPDNTPPFVNGFRPLA